jgi:hypothetical protein
VDFEVAVAPHAEQRRCQQRRSCETITTGGQIFRRGAFLGSVDQADAMLAAERFPGLFCTGNGNPEL